jgi:phosphoadenosine phosphosulfate reductase
MTHASSSAPAAAHSKAPLRVTMVKKELASGEPCKKCAQAEDMLRRRGLWDRIDEVVYAREVDPQSAGMLLAQEHDVKLAPFFLVERGQGVEVFTSVVQLVKDVLEERGDGPAHVEPSVTPSADSGAAAVSPENLSGAAGLTQAEVEAAAVELAEAEPARILAWAQSKLGRGLAIAFSGAEDVALIDMAVRSGHGFTVFCLDTGRLHAETYRFIDRVRKHYGVAIDVVFPNAVAVEALVRKKGLFSFYDDGHSECCGIRKVEPLRRMLAQRAGWATGQRRDQSPTRADVPTVVWDKSHRPEGMLKVNPLARWSQKDVWTYIRENDVPYNELHDRGFISIGCEPCTRATRPGEHERAGRWWWEEATQRECGLHKG